MKNNLPFIEIDPKLIRMSPFNVPPPNGHTTKEDYPYCCEHHTKTNDGIKEWFIKFPNCCPIHKEMATTYNIDKKNYEYLPSKIIRQIAYTESFIDEAIKQDNWNFLITKYLEYNLLSFGHPNIGATTYSRYVEHFIKAMDFKENDKRKIDILKFIDNRRVKKEGSESKVDLINLFHTFQQWVKAIPNLPQFKELKEKFTGRLPFNLLSYEEEHNPFTNLTSYKIHNQKAFVQILVDITYKQLEKVKTYEIVDTLNKNDFKERQAITIKESLRLKQEELLKIYSLQNIPFVRVIKKWLQNEKEFFKEYEIFLTPRKSIYKCYSLEWQGEQEKIIELFKLLKKHKFISYKTEQINFINAFITPLDKQGQTSSPIHWTESNRLLAYFFESLIKNTRYILHTCNYPSIIDNGNLFLNKKKKKIKNRDLISAKHAYLRDGNPHFHKKIDIIIDTINLKH